MSELLRIEGLSAGYGEAVVLQGISLALPEGDTLALLGRNGTGKTTLIQMMAGLIDGYCKVAGYPFRYQNFSIDQIDSYQGKSGQNAKAFIDAVLDPSVIGFGTIDDIEVKKPSGNAELDDSVERALKELQKKREKDPKPVPAHLVPKTRKWICYRLKVS